MEIRLQTKTKLKENYKKCIDEHIALGHMEIVTPEKQSVYIQNNYLSHRVVTKESIVVRLN